MELSLWCLRLIPACFECTSHSFFYKQKLSWLVTKWWGLILPMYLGNANTYTFETVSLYRGVGTGVYVTPVLWLTFFFFKINCTVQGKCSPKYSSLETILSKTRGLLDHRPNALTSSALHMKLEVCTSWRLSAWLQHWQVCTSTFHLRQVSGTLKAANLPNIVKNARLSQV